MKSRTVITFAVALALSGAVAALVATPAVVANGSCGPVWNAARLGTMAVQDDAYSGGDAGDGPLWAVPLLREGYSWGMLEPPVDRDGADVEDWYSLDLKGTGEFVMAEVNATLGYFQYPDDHDWSTQEALRFGIDAWRPGAEAPVAAGVTNDRGGGNVTFIADTPGEWHVRVHYAHGVLADARAGCTHAFPNPDSATTVSAPNPADYGVYFGCRPFCLR